MLERFQRTGLTPRRSVHYNPHMSKERKARIVITRGTRADCQAVLELVDTNTGKPAELNMPSGGPTERHTREAVERLRDQLHKSGVKHVDYVER